jgi:TIR domain
MKTTFLDHAFMSYAAEDEEQANILVCGLEILKKSIWFAPNRIGPGDQILFKIERGMENSRHLIALLSPHYFKSDWCQLERHSHSFSDPCNRVRRLIPVILKPCPLPLHLQSLLFCDVSDGITPEKLALIASAL